MWFLKAPVRTEILTVGCQDLRRATNSFLKIFVEHNILTMRCQDFTVCDKMAIEGLFGTIILDKNVPRLQEVQQNGFWKLWWPLDHPSNASFSTLDWKFEDSQIIFQSALERYLLQSIASLWSVRVPLNLVKADIGVSFILCVAYSLATVNVPGIWHRSLHVASFSLFTASQQYWDRWRVLTVWQGGCDVQQTRDL